MGYHHFRAPWYKKIAFYDFVLEYPFITDHQHEYNLLVLSLANHEQNFTANFASKSALSMISEPPYVTTSVKNSKWCLPILNATQQMSKSTNYVQYGLSRWWRPVDTSTHALLIRLQNLSNNWCTLSRILPMMHHCSRVKLHFRLWREQWNCVAKKLRKL